MEGPWLDIPQNQTGDPGRCITYFGITDTRGKHVPFGIRQDDRSKHTYVIGKSGMGKSTLLENMAVQDIQNGSGVCFIDPHGGTAEKLLQYVPEHRVRDVLYFAPFDLQYPISFNVLENVDGDKRHLVVAGLMSAFEKIWVDAWSARMAYILQNTISALLEFPGATLLGVNRMYIDKEYRKNVIAHVTDPSVRSFWVDEFAKYTDRYAQEATPAIQNKIGQFASNALVRNVIGQETSSFNMRNIMDERKIFIVNLSKGRVGEGNANLLGSMLITKMYLAAMSRADVPLGEQRSLPPFYLFVDEFQNFANKSFAEILSEARKYKLALTIAHQYIEQMEEEVRAAVFGNVGTMITFRVGAYDAEVLEKEYAPTFEIDDIVNLGARQVYLKLMIDSVSSQPFSARTLPPIPEPAVDQTDRVIAFSRARYSRPRAEVEKAIKDWSEKRYEDPEAESKMREREERRTGRVEEGGTRPLREGVSNVNTRFPVHDRESRRESASRSDAPMRPAARTERASQEVPGGRERAQGGGEVRRGERSPTPRPYVQATGPAASRPLPPRPVMMPRPIEKRVETNDGLRDVLTRLTASREGMQTNRQQTSPQDGHTPGGVAPSRVVDKAPVLAQDVAVTSRPSFPNPRVPETNPVPTVPTISSHQKLAPVRDDGKGVTDEGREQLRSLLATLTAQKSSSPEHKQGVSVNVSGDAAPQTRTTNSPTGKDSVVPSDTPDPTSFSARSSPAPVVLAPRRPHSEVTEVVLPPSLPKEKLNALLHVEKPML